MRGISVERLNKKQTHKKSLFQRSIFSWAQIKCQLVRYQFGNVTSLVKLTLCIRITHLKVLNGRLSASTSDTKGPLERRNKTWGVHDKSSVWLWLTVGSYPDACTSVPKCKSQFILFCCRTTVANATTLCGPGQVEASLLVFSCIFLNTHSVI